MTSSLFKRPRVCLLLGGLLMISLLVLAPLQAQDTPDPMTAPVVATPLPQTETINAMSSAPLTYGVVGVLAILLVGAMVYGSYLTRFLAKLVPPETASAIYASGVRFGLQIALNQAALTPSTLDDEFFEEMARLRGLQVIRRADGSYEVRQSDTPISKMPV